MWKPKLLWDHAGEELSFSKLLCTILQDEQQILDEKQVGHFSASQKVRVNIVQGWSPKSR